MALNPTVNLDAEETEILTAFEAGELSRAANADDIIERHRAYAAAMLRQNERISVRLSGHDLRRLQKRALLEGIPYQTLAASVLHKYLDGALQETPA